MVNYEPFDSGNFMRNIKRAYRVAPSAGIAYYTMHRLLQDRQT